MHAYETILSKQEKKWILERRVTRLSDNREVQIYPMGAERYLSSALMGNQKCRYNIRSDVEGKNVLVIPGHGNSSFLMAQAGAKSVTVYDKDPVTIAWMKAFKKYYHYREYDAQGKSLASIGELFTSLTYWYPALINIPGVKLIHFLLWIGHPNSLRRTYIHYMVALVQKAIQMKRKEDFEFDKKIQFHVGTVDEISIIQEKQSFHTVFIPYLLGVENGIENEKEIVQFLKKLIEIIPNGRIIVSPSKDVKDFYFFGKRYFVTTEYTNIYDIPGLKEYLLENDEHWFRSQGLAVFGQQQTRCI
ncbi:ABC transporter permease [Legionella sainthelensi]|uniref:ABC transporter permease n=1 Tax=Legionella sainthelensi TaxID=28087 RepID=A0A2H5FN71_9GAMM|nr:ABC transporter permease [Legionella sainthelensi]AUH72996.1 ABC transporter permease [Legionella sainthelensi]